MAVFVVNIWVLFTGLILSECYIAQAQSTVSGEFHPECDNMLECQYEIKQLNKKVDKLESHMVALLKVMEVLQSRTNDVHAELTEMKEMSSQCNRTYFELNENNYEFVTRFNDWQSARDDCSKRGGDLVAIESTEEWVYLYGFIHHHGYDNQCERFWTSSEKRVDKWVWANGDKEIDLTWPEAQPDGNGPCVNIHYNVDYGINDAPCSVESCFICEYQ